MISTGTTRRAPIAFPPVRAGVAGRRAVLSLLAVLLLVLALAVSGTFAATQRATAGMLDGDQSTTFVVQGKEHAPAAPASQGADEDKSNSSGAGHLRGILESIDEVSKVFGFVVLFGGFALLVRETGEIRKLVLSSVDLEDDSIPPQLRRRPPPHK